MNYIAEINTFYDWLETNHLPKSAIALWGALMHVNNKANWVKSFEVAISTLEFKTGFRRSELFEARNILTQKGRIQWKQRGGNLSATYNIIPFCVRITDASADASADAIQDASADANPTQTGTINKLNQTKLNQTKLNSFSKEKIKKENFEKSEKPPTDPQKKEKKETTGGGGENDDTKVCNGIIITDERFEEFRKAYCGTKGGFQSEFDNFKKKHKDWKRVIPLLLPALQNEQRWRQMAKENGQWLPEQAHLKTWINQRRWEQEFNFNFNNNGNSSNKSKSGSGVSDAYKADILNRLLG